MVEPDRDPNLELAVKFAFNFPLFEHLSDERVLADLAYEAEQSGWDAALVWDHVNLHFPGMAEGGPHAEPWIALALMAQRTEKIFLGTSITPVARRRPAKLAREILAIHRLSEGRFIFGAGLGVGTAEFDDLGEERDLPTRGQMIDESLSVLTAILSGTPCHSTGSTIMFIHRHPLKPKPTCRFGSRARGQTKSRSAARRAMTASTP